MSGGAYNYAFHKIENLADEIAKTTPIRRAFCHRLRLVAEACRAIEAERRGLLAPSRSGRPTQWAKFPDVMLSWRAATTLAREVYADIVGGLYIPDEIEVGV